VAGQVVERGRHAATLEVAAMRVHPQFDAADVPRDQHALAGARHPHGDVGVAAQQVFEAVAGHQFEREAGIGGVQIGEDGGQHFSRHHFAGGDSHRAAHALALAGSGAQQRRAGRFQRFRIGLQHQRRLGRAQALLGADEQREAERTLQRIDMAAGGGLGQPQRARRARQRTFPHDGEKRPIQLPARFRVHHTKSYS